MGRAIDMEKDIDMLKIRLETLEGIVRGIAYSIDEMSEKSTKTTHIDLVDDVKVEENDNDKEEETNDEADGSSNGKRDKKPRTSKGKSV